MVSLPGPPGLAADEGFSGSPTQRPTLPSEEQEDQTLTQQSLGQVLSRTNPTQRQQRRLFEATRGTPQLYVLSPNRPPSPVLRDAYDALASNFTGEAFDYLEGVETILNRSFLLRDDQAPSILDRLISQRVILTLEESS